MEWSRNQLLSPDVLVDTIKNLSSSKIKEKELLDLFQFETDEKKKKKGSMENDGGYKSPGSLQRDLEATLGGGGGCPVPLAWDDLITGSS